MKNPSCGKLEERLVELAEGSLPPDLRRDVQEHLAGCPHCKRLYHNFAELWEVLSPPARKEPPVALWPALEKALETQERHPFRTSAPMMRIFGLLRPAAVGIAVLVTALAGFHLGNPREEYGAFPKLSEPSLELKGVDYAAHLLEPFRDIPEGSLAEFYLGIDPQDEDKKP